MIAERIKELAEINSITKHEKIVNSISQGIQDKTLLRGDILPSVNELSSDLGYARETVVKAYKSLKERGIIKSKQGVGYFVAHDDVDQKLSVALVLYGFQTFQQLFYNKLRKTLGKDYQLDIFFHHNNKDMYSTILNEIKGQYGMYVVAPIQYQEGLEMLERFPAKKLLVVDRYQYINEEVAHITQEFEASLISVFESLEDRFQDFKRIILFYRSDVDYPEGIYTAFNEFCSRRNISYELYEDYDSSLLEKETLYFTIGDSDLWNILKDSRNAGFKLGKDIGVLSHNDSPVKEIIEDGITTFSTDFSAMGEKAAQFIMGRKYVAEIVPSVLIRRNSL